MKKLLILAALLCSLFARPVADGCVYSLTYNNFDKVRNYGQVWFVKFFSPDCSNCKHFQPVWSELASKFCNDNVVISLKSMRAFILINDVTEKELSRKYYIDWYPTILLFKNGYYHKYVGSQTLVDMKSFIYKAETVTKGMKAEWYSGPLESKLENEILEYGVRLLDSWGLESVPGTVKQIIFGSMLLFLVIAVILCMISCCSTNKEYVKPDKTEKNE
eukprot:TRINITY_DN1904_c0_g1_i11.p1 TRINITY_DN1904_c0_g1~~TRINITY_DN1904_c0_g1_i11.p1  ORF type:complete len:218 (-),score=32.39 TRINITY_DN1904_c0_g1_i11:211-864(-)